MLRVSNDRKYCFISLDSTIEKMQKADFVKAAEFLVWELSIFLWTTVQYGIKYNRLFHLFLSSMCRSGRFECKPSSCKPDHHDLKRQ